MVVVANEEEWVMVVTVIPPVLLDVVDWVIEVVIAVLLVVPGDIVVAETPELVEEESVLVIWEELLRATVVGMSVAWDPDTSRRSPKGRTCSIPINQET